MIFFFFFSPTPLFVYKGFVSSVAALPKSRRAPTPHTQTHRQTCPMQIRGVVTMRGNVGDSALSPVGTLGPRPSSI